MNLVLCDSGDAEPPCEDDSVQSDSEGGSNSEISDGEENGTDVDGGSDEEEADDEDGEDSNANAGWAEAMAKILGKKTPESKTSILVKNKELDKMKEKEREELLERKKQVMMIYFILLAS